MRAFTRWYKKPSRDLEDLRSQVEPMLRGQKCLLEEFSLFFPNDKPPERFVLYFVVIKSETFRFQIALEILQIFLQKQFNGRFLLCIEPNIHIEIMVQNCKSKD